MFYLLKPRIKNIISKYSVLFFAILTIFSLGIKNVEAATLGACGEIAVSGTYTLSGDLGTPGDTCLTITASGVTIEGSSTHSVLGNIVGNRTNYTLSNVVDTGDLSIFYYNNAAADGNWANKANWWFDSNYTETANIAGVTVPSTQDEVVVDGNVSQISTGVASVKSARFINNATWNVGSSITDGLVWTKYDNTIPAASNTTTSNGRMAVGTSGRGDETHAYSMSPSMIKDGSTYKLWYVGQTPAGNARIFYATSPNGLTWTKYDNTIPSASDTTSTNGRLALGTSGKGDSWAVANHVVIKDGSTYKMWYGGNNGTNWRIYYATSPDGLTWTKYDNTVPSNSDTTSTNGRIPLGSSGKGDSVGTYLGTVLKEGDIYKMWYRGYDGTSVRMYYATSPDGLTWTKHDNTIPDRSDTLSTDGKLALGSVGKGDDIHAQIPVIYKDGATYRMSYAGYKSGGGGYDIFFATSPDGLTWTKYNNVVPSTSDTTSTDGRIPRGLTAGRGDITSVIPGPFLIESNLFKIWYSGYNGTNWRGFYATAPNSYRALNLSVDAAGSVTFDDNSKFGKGTIATADGNIISEVNFNGTSIATEISIRAGIINIDTSTSTAGIFEILSDSTVINVDNLAQSSTINVVGSNVDLNLNNSVVLTTASGNNLNLTLNDSARVSKFALLGNSTVTFNTDYYHGSSVPTGGTLVINYGGLDGVISSGTTFYDSASVAIIEIEFKNSTVNNLRGINVHTSFYNNSSNAGIINADVTVNAPSSKPVGGTVTGSVVYNGYDGFYFNNAAADGNWLNLSNWWSDSAHTTPASRPTQYDDVYVSGNITSYPNLGNAINTTYNAGSNGGTWSLGTFSLSVWYWSKNVNFTQILTSATTYIQIRGQGNTPPYFRAYMGGSHIDFFAPSGTQNLVDKWTHIVFVRAADGKGYMYFNGQPSPQNGSFVGNTTHVPTALPLVTHAILDEFIVYNKALSQSEVTALYNGGTPVKITDYTNVYVHLPMDQSSGTTALDVSGNGRNVTFSNNFPTWQSGKVNLTSEPVPRIQQLNMSAGTNSITVRTTNGAIFSGTAVHNGTVYGNATFLEDSPTMSPTARASTLYPTDDNAATLTRIYTADATTTKDFTLNGGRWIVESDGADVDLSGATYAVSGGAYQSDKNVFRAKNGATFIENPSINGGAHVVPKLTINSPVAGTILRWNPVVDWDDADTCQYKWGANGTYTNVSCASGGSDIPKPTAFATTTLYVKGIYSDTSYSEKASPSFLYDNVSPAPTDCTIAMDEPTRQYYYLEGNITGDCTVTANATLKGASSTESVGYTITGKVIANATSTTNGFNLTLENITITDEVTANGSGSGKRGGNITVASSTLANITTNGGAISVTNSVTSQLASNSNDGGILGGNITIDVSTTSDIYANGGDITVSTSSVGLLDSTSPTSGIAGGDITVTDPTSTIASITTNGGNVTLTNVEVVGDITANGNTGGVSSGTINIEFSTTTAIYANGGTNSSGNGGNGATITISTSTTGLIEANGADADGDGGDGGIITITNSIGTSASSTPITANGGDSTSCGDGGDSGVITIINTTYGTITAEPGVGFNGGCPSSTKISGTRTQVVTIGDGHSSIPRPVTPSPTPTPTPTNPDAIGGGINRFFTQGIGGLDLTPIQRFNIFGDNFTKIFQPDTVGTTRLPRVFTDLKALGQFLLDKIPVNIFPSLQKFVTEPIPDELTKLMPNTSRLLAAVGVTRSQELAGLMRSPKLISDIEHPEKYGLFRIYSGDVLVNTYVTYEKAVEKFAQLIKSAPSQILSIGSYVGEDATDAAKNPYIIFQGQKKNLTPTFDGYYATSIIAPSLEGRYLIETSTDVQILLDVLPQNQSNEQKKPWGIFHRLWKLFH